MTAINATTARRNLYQLISDVNESRTPVTITNARGKNAVLLSEDDWNAVQETLYLNAIPGMSASILAADAEDLDACRTYDPNDKANYMASADLIEFAEKHGLYDPATGPFDFHTAYIRDVKLDTTYNYPRVWGLQAMFSPAIENDVTKNTFPVFAKAEHPLSLDDLRRAFRFHYQGTEHDPYLHNNPKEKYRPVSIFRTTQTHILHVRPELPQAIGRVDYMAMGMAVLGVFLPLYQGITSYPEAYTKGGLRSDADSAYWKFRKVQTLGMVNYNRYAPLIQETYARWEAETTQRQREMEAQYLAVYETQPIHARELLQAFSDKMLQSALDVTDRLIEELFTRLAEDIQAEYRFAGA